MKMYEMTVRLTMTEETLGTAAPTAEIHSEYIASKAPDAGTLEEEVAALGVDEVAGKGTTRFPRDENGNPFVWDYQIRGFFKSACGALRKVTGSRSSKVKAYKKEVDELIFIEERQIPFFLIDGEDRSGVTEVGRCERPLRASTPQGERVALAASETVPAGAHLEFTVAVYVESDLKLVREWLNHGRWNGLGQWRNSGKGRFVWEEIVNGKPVGHTDDDDDGDDGERKGA